MPSQHFAVVGLACAAVIAAAVPASSQTKGSRYALPFVGIKDIDKALADPKGYRAEREAILEEGTAARKMFDTVMEICGPKEDFQDVELYDGKKGPTTQFVARHQSPVAGIRWKTDFGADVDPGSVSGQPWCTGTLISQNLFLSAAHCFNPEDNAEKNIIFPKKEGQYLPAEGAATKMEVVFNYQINGSDPQRRLRPGEAYPVLRLVEYGFALSPQLDYAIIEIGAGADGKLPGAKFGVAVVDASDAAVAEARNLTLIQHPHGRPKKIAAGPKFELSETLLFYNDLDTLGGSSGSGVLSEEGKVIAVHVHGGCQELGGANEATMLKAVRPFSKIIK